MVSYGIRYQVSGIKCQVSGIRYQVPGIKCQVSGARYQVSGIRYQVWGIRYRVLGIRYQVPILLWTGKCLGHVSLCVSSTRLRIRDGWWSFLGRVFRTRSVMGRLWDDHFRHLGHPPKCYRDASSGNTSLFWYHFNVILTNSHWAIISYHIFVPRIDFQLKKQVPCQEACKCKQSSGVGMHQNPHFPLKPV